jgi:hypothetical protein
VSGHLRNYLLTSPLEEFAHGEGVPEHFEVRTLGDGIAANTNIKMPSGETLAVGLRSRTRLRLLCLGCRPGHTSSPGVHADTGTPHGGYNFLKRQVLRFVKEIPNERFQAEVAA